MTTPAPPLPPAVAFVSSGPGAADLLTLRAADRLRAAQVVLLPDQYAGDYFRR